MTCTSLYHSNLHLITPSITRTSINHSNMHLISHLILYYNRIVIDHHLPISLVVNVVDNVLDLLQGSYITRRTYAVGTTPKTFTASYSSGGRWDKLLNNAGTFYNISTTVSVNQYVINRKGIRVLNQRYFLSFFSLLLTETIAQWPLCSP